MKDLNFKKVSQQTIKSGIKNVIIKDLNEALFIKEWVMANLSLKTLEFESAFDIVINFINTTSYKSNGGSDLTGELILGEPISCNVSKYLKNNVNLLNEAFDNKIKGDNIEVTIIVPDFKNVKSMSDLDVVRLNYDPNYTSNEYKYIAVNIHSINKIENF